jgi:hypothetical protein
MLTVSWRRKRRVPPRRGRGAIPGLIFCFAQCSMRAVGVSSGSQWQPRAASLTLACFLIVPATFSGQGFSISLRETSALDPPRNPAGGACTRQTRSLDALRGCAMLVLR